MAKAATIKIKLESTADTGFFYVTKKNSRTMTEKMVKRKYDPVARKHVDFKETKIKQPLFTVRYYSLPKLNWALNYDHQLSVVNQISPM